MNVPALLAVDVVRASVRRTVAPSALTVAATGAGLDAFVTPPVEVTAGPHPAIAGVLAHFETSPGVWRIPASQLAGTLAGLHPGVLAVGSPAAFARCSPATRAIRAAELFTANRWKVPGLADQIAAAAGPRDTPGWIVIAGTTRWATLTWWMPAVRLGRLTVSSASPSGHRLELDELDAILAAAAERSLVCFADGDGRALTALRSWQGAVLALRRTAVPAVAGVHRDRSPAPDTVDPDDDPHLEPAAAPPAQVFDVDDRVPVGGVAEVVWAAPSAGLAVAVDPTVADLAHMATVLPTGTPGLLPHQDLAVSRYAATSRGLVLTMAPGSGKTPAAVTAVAVRRGSRSVVVCPAGIVDQWLAEFSRWAPSVRVAVWDAAGPGPQPGVTVVATSDVARFEAATRRCGFADLVVDEARFLRGTSAAAQACRRLRARAQRGLLLTGTPAARAWSDLSRLIAFARDEAWGGAAFDRAARADLAALEPAVVFADATGRREVNARFVKAPDPGADLGRLDAALGVVRDLERRRAAAPLAPAAAGASAGLGRALIGLRAAAVELSGQWALAAADSVPGTLTAGVATLVFCHSRPARARLAALLAERDDLRVTVVESAAQLTDAASRLATAEVDVVVVGRAGDEGANLTAARRIVVVDPGFDPAVLRQRVGRADRVGHDGTPLEVLLIAPGQAAARAARTLWRASRHQVCPGEDMAVMQAAVA